MDKKKIAQVIYNIILVICVLLLVFSLIFIKVKDADGNVIVNGFIIRYSIIFYMFSILLPFGIITREYLIGIYNIKKIRLKIILSGLVVILGSVLIFTLKNLAVCQAATVFSLGVLFFILTPTVKPNEK